MFEGGESLYVGVQGDISGGELYVLPAGVRLSVIPTFIDDDRMLLAVNASRSAFEDLDEPVGLFEEQLLTIRTSVTANVLMEQGQSLILSGLAERQKQITSNKIPTEANVPGLSESNSREFTNTVTIILTPRSLDSRGNDANPPVFSEEQVAAYEALLLTQVESHGLNSAEDAYLGQVLNPASRSIVMSPHFAPATDIFAPI